ncbi:Zinc finger MYM-type protein 1 [Trichinella zimbabwensis]|uniref:Zinc finger MYM-type protein 1 n=1 Tax=Trichinella zimbabwensis TaxID=268475 RepID=A0A0V1I4Q1_9BILA|nr:Zinc finger MYM-type protein 1 [Trichinella zimbabwensis]
MLKNRYYVTEIFDIVKFLSSNELSFRGDDESFSVSSSETCPSFGLFLRLFEFTLVRDTRLQEEMKYILEVATYELPEIQNEVLEIMATTVCENIADKCRRSDIRFYCIKVDGTEGHSGYEMISTVLQFVYEGKVEEHLLGIVESENMQAVALCDVILNGLEIAGLDPRYIISQCYDGASVMAGVRGGVQALMQERVKKIYTFFRTEKLRYLAALCSVLLTDMKYEIKTAKVFLESNCNSFYDCIRNIRSKLQHLLKNPHTILAVCEQEQDEKLGAPAFRTQTTAKHAG